MNPEGDRSGISPFHAVATYYDVIPSIVQPLPWSKLDWRLLSKTAQHIGCWALTVLSSRACPGELYSRMWLEASVPAYVLHSAELARLPIGRPGILG
jgi:hypothetical protein